MDDQELLRNLARVALDKEKAEGARWERWDRLNDGALSVEEESELRALAASSVSAQEAYEAFRPFSPEFRAQVVAAIGPLGVGDAAQPAAPPVRPAPREQPPPRQPFFFGWRFALGGSGLAAAAVAVAFLFFRLPALPEFQLKVFGTAATRAEAGTEFFLGGAFKADVLPATRLSSRSPLEVRCFVTPAAGRLQPADCAVAERAEGGGMKVHGTIPAGSSPGPATLWIVLAYPSHQPSAATISGLQSESPTLTKRWVALPHRLDIQAS